MYPTYNQTEKYSSRTESRPICYTICKGKQKHWRDQARFIQKPLKATVYWSVLKSPLTASPLYFCYLKFTWNNFKDCITACFLWIKHTVFLSAVHIIFSYLKAPFVSRVWKHHVKTKAHLLVITHGNLSLAEIVFWYFQYLYLIAVHV